MPAVHPGPTSVFVHSHEASGKLVVEFARNPKDFPLNNYVQIQTSQKPAGYYLVMTSEQAARVINTDLREFMWAPGNEAPDGNWNLESFEFQPFECKRYAYPFRMDMETARNASWDIVAQHARYAAQQAMTVRTQLAANVLLDSSNYAANHVINATSAHGAWSTSPTSGTGAFAILNTLTAAAEVILDDTLGMVTKDDLVLVMGSGLARLIAKAPEITEMLKYQAGFDFIRGASERTNVSYGVP
ncbi:MAG TPA: hypothetical protein PLS24_03545, partial [Sedimentisphaerales bacterium]|nr:hypothetical protein [Sedimentisphaerales bacterium]